MNRRAPGAPLPLHPMLLTGIGAALVLGTAGCPPPEIPERECLDGVIIVSDPSASGTHFNRRGQIKLLERHQADGTAATTVVGAKFGDFTLSTAESQGGLPLSDACTGLTGQPVRSDKHCEYTTTSCEDNSDCSAGADCREYDRLDVAGVRVEGLVGGTVALDRQANNVGSFIKAGLTQLYTPGLIDIFVTAATGTAAHKFVANDVHLLDIPAPRFVTVTAPVISGGVSIGRENLIIEWEPGDNPDDLVYIDVMVEQISTVSQGQTRNAGLSCVALDQPRLEGKGCQTLWGEALTWLMSPEDGWRIGEEVTIIIGRRSEMVEDLGGDTPDTVISASLTAEVQGKMTP